MNQGFDKDWNEEYVLCLLDKQELDSHCSKELALWHGASNGWQKLVHRLARDVSQINRCEKNGVSCLYIAAQNGNGEVCKTLLAFGALPNVGRLETGSTPLFIAAQRGHQDVVEILVNSGANVEDANSHGCTPFILACSMGNIQMTTYLISHGADIYRRCEGRTGLHWARQEKHQSLWRLLAELYVQRFVLRRYWGYWQTATRKPKTFPPLSIFCFPFAVPPLYYSIRINPVPFLGFSENFAFLKNEDPLFKMNLSSPVYIGTGSTGIVHDGEVIAALINNKSFEIGIALCDMSCMTVALSQFSDSASFFKTLHICSVHGVKELLIPESSCTATLAETLAKQLPETSFATLNRKHYNETTGSHLLRKLSACSSRVDELTATTRYLALSAVCALVKYIELALGADLLPKTVHFRWFCPQNFVEISRSTAKALQLFHGENPFAESICFTVTPMGKRLLRSNIVQPPCSFETSMMRLDAVDFLLSNPRLQKDLRDALSSMHNVDLGLSFGYLAINHQRSSHTECELFVRTLQHFRLTATACSQAACILRTVRNGPLLMEHLLEGLRVDWLQQLGEHIDSVLDREALDATRGCTKAAAPHRIHSLFAVKPRLLDVLDAAREHYSSEMDRLFNLCDRLKGTHNLTSLRIFQQRSQFFFTFDLRQNNHAPGAVFVRKALCGSKRVLCTTDELSQINVKLSDCVAEILHLQAKLLKQFMQTNVFDSTSNLQAVCESVSLLDLILSHAAFASKLQNRCRPELVVDGSIELLSFVPPNAANLFSPLSLQISGDSFAMLLTGVNSSGKTTVLRSVAQATILALIGSFAPARKLTVRKVESILTAFNSDLLPTVSASSFQQEMLSLSNFCRASHQNSLVLFDELGRSTSQLESAALAWALVEWLCEMKCVTLFATHSLLLTKICSSNSHIVNFHLGSSIKGGNYHFSRQLLPGPQCIDGSAVEIAQVLSLPLNFLKSAHTNLEVLHSQSIGSTLVDPLERLIREQSSLSLLLHIQQEWRK